MKTLRNILLALCCVISASAQVTIQNGTLRNVSFTNAPAGGGVSDTIWMTVSSAGTPRQNFDGTVGCTFTVSSSITITMLASYVVSGSHQTHRVAVWDISLNKLAEISYDKTGLSAGFNFIAVTPVTLTAGTYYLGEEEFSGGDNFLNDDTTLSTTGAGTITFSSFQSASYGAPTGNGGSSSVACFGPVNFKYH